MEEKWLHCHQGLFTLGHDITFQLRLFNFFIIVHYLKS